MPRILLAAPLLSLLFACGQCGSPPPASVPADGCAAGTLGCACGPESKCLRGQCAGGVCSLCTRGEEGCLCRRDGSCEDALVCRDELCGSCPAGSGGCACDGERCDEGFDCEEGACVTAACVPGTADCPCRQATSPACDAELTCLGDATCRACDADRPGCFCEALTGCTEGLFCDDSACRLPPSCADLVAEGFCLEHQVCEQAPGQPAVCAAARCVDGFVWDGGRCVPGRPNCSEDLVGSVLAECTSRLRRCLEDDDGARCGDCIDGSRDVQGVCVGRLTCGGTSCLESEYCDSSTREPICRPLACAPGEAMSVGRACRDCGFTCSGEGLTGRVWPFRTITDTCLCETLPGFFMPPGGDTRAEICDQDGDGWVREEVRDSALTTDPALVQNERCATVEVAGVILRDELGTDARVASCAEGLLLNPEPTECSSAILLPLLESLRNDTPGFLAATSTPAYGGSQGRRLRAREVNGLTKACVSALGDFNDDQTEDYLEVQATPELVGDDPIARLRSFSYFLETHRSYVERQDGAMRLVIEERYRCDPRDLALRYDPLVDPAAPSDRFDAGSGATYWRSCQRGVAPGFDPNADPPLPGWDFAQWSCPGGGPDCQAIPRAPPHAQLDLRTPIAPETPSPEDATLCRLGSRFPTDGLWRGMHHASQFQCVGVGSGPGRKAAADFGAAGKWVMNQCRAVACEAGDATCSDSRTVVPGSQAYEPILLCQALPLVGGDGFGFAARRYSAYGVGFGGDYAGGCVSEDEEYRDVLCPAPVFAVAPEETSFGQDTCFIAPCQLGRADCDGNALNGCELNATTTTNCNGCGVQCAPGNAVGDCSTGVCQVGSCSTGWGDCDGRADTGCETNTRPTPPDDGASILENCGGCGEEFRCEIAGGEASCATGICEAIDCAPGKGNCNGDDGDGCETTLTSSTHCGGCGISCSPTHAIGSCSSGSCHISSCDPGWGDCDGSATNGCESSLGTTSNCGLCGTTCDPAHSTGQCAGGAVCSVASCDSGYGNCNGDAADGCERRLKTSTNCGTCGNPCSLPGASSSCSTGTCRLLSCDEGKAHCDTNTKNGCEVNLNNGGSCGSAADMGSEAGDSQCGVFCGVNTAWTNFNSTTGRGEKWLKARVVDALGVCSEDLVHRISLEVPAEVDYDLYVWDSCGGNLLASARKSRGVDEEIVLRRTDGSTGDRGYTYWLEVRFHSGSDCGEWSLNFEGRNTKC